MRTASGVRKISTEIRTALIRIASIVQSTLIQTFPVLNGKRATNTICGRSDLMTVRDELEYILEVYDEVKALEDKVVRLFNIVYAEHLKREREKRGVE